MKTHDVIAATNDVLASVHRSHDGVIVARPLSHRTSSLTGKRIAVEGCFATSRRFIEFFQS
jgi:hypothetical protein